MKNRHVKNIIDKYGLFDITDEVREYFELHRNWSKHPNREKVFDNCPYGYILYADYYYNAETGNDAGNRLEYDDAKYYKMKPNKKMIKIKLVGLTETSMKYVIYDYHHHVEVFYINRLFSELGGVPLIQGNEIINLTPEVA